MNDRPLDIASFLRLVIEALEAAGVDYLIGGAIAEWAWGEPRATQDLDLVFNIHIEAINKLSKELEKRDMLIPAEIILDSILEDRADIPITADTALRLARFFGNSPQFWMGLQTQYDLDVAEDQLGIRLDREVRPLAMAG